MTKVGSDAHQGTHPRMRRGAVLLVLTSVLLFSTTMPKIAIGFAAWNGALVYPFQKSSPTAPNWKIYNGYGGGDHADYSLYSFDFVTETGSTEGQPVFAPATGTVVWGGHTWDKTDPNGNCISINITSAPTYNVMVCHIDFAKVYKPGDLIQQGVQLGVVGAKDDRSSGPHIHMNLHQAQPPGAPPQDRVAVPFSDSWSIAGCSFPAGTAWTGTVGLPAYCPTGGQPVAGTLQVGWGSASWGINRARSALFEVRPLDGNSSTDIVNQVVQSDSNGTFTVNLSGLNLQTQRQYDFYLWPTGFLRQKQRLALAPGNNGMTFTMTKPGKNCITGQTAPQVMMGGDVDGTNVINSKDYEAVLYYYGDPLLPLYHTVTGNATFDSIDLNSVLYAVCNLGSGQPVTGDGGLEDAGFIFGPTGSASSNVSTEAAIGIMFLSPVAKP